jgi:hypothetical protein
LLKHNEEAKMSKNKKNYEKYDNIEVSEYTYLNKSNKDSSFLD